MNPFRKFLSDQITAINGMLQGGTVLPAVKTAFEAIRDNFQTQLNAMPADGGGTEDMLKVLGMQSATITALNSAIASVGQTIEAQWNQRITAGELIPKERHTTLCAEAAEAARGAGLTEGRNAAKAEYDTLLATERAAMERRQEVARNGLPVPPDEVLKLKDEDWKVRVSEAQTRLKQVTEAGIKSELPFVGRYAWATEEDAKAMADIVKLVPKGPGGPNPNPLLGGGGGDDKGAAGAIKFSF